MNNLVKSTLNRKIRPLTPGDIIQDILEDKGISIGGLYLYNLELDKILEGERPMTYFWAKELESHLDISAELLMNLQRKVDIWDSQYEI